MIAEAFPEDGGLFCCTVSNTYGSKNSTAHLAVTAGESHGDPGHLPLRSLLLYRKSQMTQGRLLLRTSAIPPMLECSDNLSARVHGDNSDDSQAPKEAKQIKTRANESSVKTHVCAFPRGQCPVVFFNVGPVEGVKV